MKCPKCEYLGFETGERCKNCGYDFSLLASSAFEMPEPDIAIRAEDLSDESMDMWLNDLDEALPTPNLEMLTDLIEPPAVDESRVPPSPVSAAAIADGVDDRLDVIVEDSAEDEDESVEVSLEPAPQLRSVESALPLFIREDDEDDTPLITLPAAPRPPLAVRRTPEIPRLRAVSRLRTVEPALDFRSEPESEDDDRDDRMRAADEPVAEPPSLAASMQSNPGRRLAAAGIDNAILASLHLAVVYFTMRMAGLEASEWQMIPPVPLGIFLGMMTFAYFTAFTAVGGQTIGKMAAGIRVVSEDNRAVGGAVAARRTLAALFSYVTVGLAYVPGFFGERRTIHDRVAHTRVVAPPSA